MTTLDAASRGDRAGQGQDAEQEPPRWLDASEQHAWRSFIVGVNALTERLSQVLVQHEGIDLTLNEYEILVRLSETPGHRVRMSELADSVVHSRSRLTHTVARLEKRGIVERVRCSADGRGREAVLTEEGMALLRRAAPVHVRSVRRYLLDVVGPEDLLTLGRIMGRTLEHDPVGHEEAPEGPRARTPGGDPA